MNPLNETAWEMVLKMCAHREALNVTVTTVECGALVLDMGVRAPGGLAAGLAMAEIGTGGLGTAGVSLGTLCGKPWLWVSMTTDHPALGCFLSQAAHWPVKMGAYQAMGSGPACLLNPALDPSKKFGVRETTQHAVLVLETGKLPDDNTCHDLAEACGVEASNLALLVAPTSSLAGCVQVAARSVETALHKLAHLGFELDQVASGIGRCPVATPPGNDLQAIGSTNDMVIFASQVWLAVKGATDETLAEVVKAVPANSSPSYGKPFLMILSEAGDFYNIDPGLFAPAEISLASLDTGKVFHAGGVDEERIQRIL